MAGQSHHGSRALTQIISGVLRTLAVCTPMVLLETPMTQAQTFQPPPLSVAIPEQPIAQALGEFARQTGLQLIYISTVVRGQHSRPVPRALSANEALAQMLRGTGLDFEYVTPQTIRILAEVVGPPQATPIGTFGGDALQEIIVTANRREENLKNVPMSIHVLTEATLAELSATTFDDFVRYLPGVTAHGDGPGQNNIYVRGLGTTKGEQGSGVFGSFPNVAVYLDEQSVQLPSRNLDIYAADLDRIEILEGPQGTLFGAGAEAGVVRYITNKPKLDRTEGRVDAGYATTAHGGQSRNIDATVNIPLIPDRLAVRAVIYDEKRGGYINNLPATFARAPTDPGVAYFFNGNVPVDSVAINNFNIAADHINPVSYNGVRVEGLYRFNEDWDALLAQSYQSIEADGVFAEMAANSLGETLPDLSVQLYNPSYDKDRFENTALTINGRAGALKLVYAGSYLVRNVEQVQDYTQYSRNTYADYYQCTVAGFAGAAARCFTPSSTWRDVERNTHQSHELRLSTSSEGRVRAVGGLFYENYRIAEQVDFSYLTALPYFHPIGPPAGIFTLNGSSLAPDGTLVGFDTPGALFVPASVTSNNPNVRPLGDGFFNDITRGYTQRAVYTSVDVDLIPNTLTLTAGTRYSRTNTWEVGSTVGSSGCELIIGQAAPPQPCVNHSYFINIDAEDLDKTSRGFNSRANLAWKITEDVLLYYTWSQGFRAGGFNRAPVSAPFDSPLADRGYPWQVQAGKHGGWVGPSAFQPDSLTNNELGWKTQWMNSRIQWNGALYQEDWSHTQTEISGLVVGEGEIVNGGNFRVRGLETSAAASVAAGLTIEVSGAWNHSELVKQATFLWRDGTPIDFNALRTSDNQKLENPNGELGTPLAAAPPFQGNIRARYEFPFKDCEVFAQISAMHQSHSLATTYRLSYDLQGNSLAYDLRAFTTYDAALGVGRSAWLAQLYGENLTDTRAEQYADYNQWYKAVTVSRPRTLGLRFTYKFSGSPVGK